MRIFFILFPVLLFYGKMEAQSPSTVLADRIARKMKDSLLLDEGQRESIYRINLRIDSIKMTIRSEYSGTDSLRSKIQQVENSRDELYRPVLGSDKYLLYRQKKRNLVSSN